MKSLMVYSTYTNENITSYRMTLKLMATQRLATKEKGARLSRFLIQQNTTIGIMIIAIHVWTPSSLPVPKETPNAEQNTCKCCTQNNLETPSIHKIIQTCMVFAYSGCKLLHPDLTFVMNRQYRSLLGVCRA